jgi:uncharacterized lipoprotein YddW (UPF0748 family)
VDHNITSISVSIKQDEDHLDPSNEFAFRSGTLYYQSKIPGVEVAPFFFGTFAHLIELAHEHGISVKAWLPQFHDYAAVNYGVSHGQDWQMYRRNPATGKAEVYSGASSFQVFANPVQPDLRAYELKIIREILNEFDIDAILLDWVRYDSYEMDVSPYTQNLFQKRYGIDILSKRITINATYGEPDWEFMYGTWTTFRNQIIADHIKDVKQAIKEVRPSVKLGIYAMPPFFTECGQDIALFKDVVDYVAPMAYASDWGFPASWIYRDDGLLADVKAKIGNVSKIVPVMGKGHTLKEYTEIMGNLSKKYPEINTISMFNYLKWTEEDFALIERVSHLVDIST